MVNIAVDEPTHYTLLAPILMLGDVHGYTLLKGYTTHQVNSVVRTLIIIDHKKWKIEQAVEI
jgi:hypothetical protein